MPVRYTLEFHEDGSATYEVVEINKGKKNNPVAEMELNADEARRVVQATETTLNAIRTEWMSDVDFLDRIFPKSIPAAGGKSDTPE